MGFGSFSNEMRIFGTMGFMNLFLARTGEGISDAIGNAVREALKQVGDETFEAAMLTFQVGDDSWEPIGAKYADEKRKLGQQPGPWRRNDELMNAMVSFEVTNGVWFVGWLRGQMNEDGSDMAVVAEALEFGWNKTSRVDLPPRPLIEPAATAAMKNFEKRLKNGLRAKLIEKQGQEELFLLGRAAKAGVGI